jgi:hypothetical protein
VVEVSTMQRRVPTDARTNGPPIGSHDVTRDVADDAAPTSSGAVVREPVGDAVSAPAAPIARRKRARTDRERRTVTKLVRLSPAEARRIERGALAAGRPPACFLREAALGAAPRPRRTAGVDPVIAELVRLGTTLRRLRDGVASPLGPDAIRPTVDALDAALGAVLDAIRRVEHRVEDRVEQRGRDAAGAR